MSEKTAAKPSKTSSKSPKKSEKGLPQGFHPNQHEIEVVMSDGSKMTIMTSWGKPGDKMYLDVDSKNHPAWQEKGKAFVNESNQQISKFKNKFGDL